MQNRTLDFLKSLELPTGGVKGWPDGPVYPEITAYLIPTLLDWGETEFSNRCADYLVQAQNPDGSFDGVDGHPAVFDTGAGWEGLTAAGRTKEANKARDYIQAHEGTQFYNIRVRGLLGMKTEIVVNVPDNLRTHYWAYALEGYYRLGQFEYVKAELAKLPRGQQPYTLDGTGSDTCATAQVAKLRLLLGLDAAAEVTVLRSLVNGDGSLPHDLNNPKKVAWACKYYLDVEHLLKQTPLEWWQVKEWQFSKQNIDMAAWKEEHPFGISGCFRVRNDHEFLEEAVMSHLPYLDEAVIALQPSDDKTMEVVKKLAKNPKVRVVKYPVAPIFITDPEWESVPENSIRSFVYLSNWALSQCRFSWIARIEADVICLSPFQNIVDRIKAEPDARRLYGRVILNVAGKDRDMVSATVPRNGGWDECVFPNSPEYHFVRKPRYEVLLNPGESECMGFSALHMKRCKADKIGWNNETYLPFTKEGVSQALRDFYASNPYPGPDNPEGEECLFER